ncbi:MAG TPA: PfkB family carbohydrate kinase [Vicinamibacteria bacterium]|nr:PfkB family carbohydrate kinase [Vicinamibacteria bacterium]
MSRPRAPRLLVVGGASLDVLHFRGRTVRSPGGAGLYTALAAARAGARVTMYAPLPRPMPDALRPAAERVEWIGPEVRAEELPSFEIAHRGGGRTEMIQALPGVEPLLAPEALPNDALDVDWACCIPLLDSARQLEFVRFLKARGRRVACGTYHAATRQDRGRVQALLAEADAFFCNEREASEIFGDPRSAEARPGQLLFVTFGERGALVAQGSHRTEVAGVEIDELDPTGAGDAFCGTALSLLARGAHPVEAARGAAAAAAEMVTAPGPEALLRPSSPAGPPRDGRVAVDREQVERVARLVSQADVAEFDFVGAQFPEAGAAHALDFFFAATLQQFGFWTESAGGYHAPMVAPIGGRSLKGSDYLWAAYRRWMEVDPSGLAPAGQARLGADAFRARLRSDAAEDPLPASDLHLEQARAYGRDMLALGLTPAGIVDAANASPRPLLSLLERLDHVGGYKEDPLRKKSALLAVILQQRPERFLRSTPGEMAPPIVDYHVQRSCLRTGLVGLRDEGLRRRLVSRRTLDARDEDAVRRACAAAVEELQRLSGRSMGAVDYLLFMARERCPETAEPECARCVLDPACAHDKPLFQPVLRTTFY